jgi:hypothetical protein
MSILSKAGRSYFSRFLYYIILSDVLLTLRQEDLSMVLALASTWTVFLAFGSLACLGPISYTVGMAYQNAFDSGLSYRSQTSVFGFLASVNSILFIVLGFVIGYPVASASGNNFHFYSTSLFDALISKFVLKVRTTSQLNSNAKPLYLMVQLVGVFFPWPKNNNQSFLTLPLLMYM